MKLRSSLEILEDVGSKGLVGSVSFSCLGPFFVQGAQIQPLAEIGCVAPVPVHQTPHSLRGKQKCIRSTNAPGHHSRNASHRKPDSMMTLTWLR